jgi:hypothetical protein
MSKDQFMEDRERSSNHFDKGIIEYWKFQNADKKQIEHLKGNKQNWK